MDSETSQRRATRHSAQPTAIEVRYGTVFLAHGTTVSLDGGSARSRLTRRLIEAFQHTPGLALMPETLVAEVWPGAVDVDSARVRLKVAVHRLRAAGLPVVTFGSGYALDPRTTFVELPRYDEASRHDGR